jgi:hypothetical protein
MWAHAGQLLHGFPEDSTEAAYLAFKNRRCLVLSDGIAAAVSCSVLLARPSDGSQNLILQLVTFVYLLPGVAMLLDRGWYLRHREQLVLALCALRHAGRAVAHAAAAVAFGTAYAAGPLTGWSLAATAAASGLYSTVTYQVRFCWALPLALLDGTRLACYGAAVTGELASALVAGSTAAAVVLLGSAMIDGRCRAQFAAGQQSLCCH